MATDAFELIEDISFHVQQKPKPPIQVVLAPDLQQLTQASDEDFGRALQDVKFSVIAQEVNLRCYFYHIDQGDIMTIEAAYAVVARLPVENEFIRQVSDYVEKIVDICLRTAEVDTEHDQ